MNSSKIFLVLTIFTYLYVQCSEQKQKIASQNPMVWIREWSDVTPFEGSIVVYKASTYYFTKGENGFVIDSCDPTLRVGFVKSGSKSWNSSVFERHRHDFGYEMARLIKKDAVCSACALTNEMMRKNDMKYFAMREATPSEKIAIKVALKNKRAQFDYQFCIEKDLKELLAQ